MRYRICYDLHVNDKTTPIEHDFRASSNEEAEKRADKFIADKNKQLRHERKVHLIRLHVPGAHKLNLSDERLSKDNYAILSSVFLVEEKLVAVK